MSGTGEPDRTDGAAPAPPPYAPPPYPTAPPPYPGAPSAQPPSPAGGYGVPPVPPSTGTVSWALGFLQFVPGIGLLLAGIVMAVVYPSVSRRGGVARANARGAANWGLTVVVGIVIGIVLAVVIWTATNHQRGFLPTGFGVLLIIAVGIVHLITTIVGTIRASSGRVFSPPYAIPFIRR